MSQIASLFHSYLGSEPIALSLIVPQHNFGLHHALSLG